MAAVLILRAGSATSNNVIRSLRAGDPSMYIVGCNDDRFVLKKSMADVNYGVPPPEGMLVSALHSIIERERIDLLIPTIDIDVMQMCELRGKLSSRTFLPATAVVKLCQDKYELTTFLRERGIPVPLTYPVGSLDDVDELFRLLRPHEKLWCRIRAGTGSFGAIPVTQPDQVRSWIRYWEEMRGVPPGSFTLSEYLPGRDFGVQSLWHEGMPILTKMSERLTYMDTGSPSGVSSMPALAKTAFEPDVIEACEGAVRTLDAIASGVFFIDVKRSTDGVPCITEINAGRFGAMTNIYDLAGDHNMATLYVRLGIGERVQLREARDYAAGYYFVRSVDTVPLVLHIDDLFTDVADWKAGQQQPRLG